MKQRRIDQTVTPRREHITRQQYFFGGEVPSDKALGPKFVALDGHTLVVMWRAHRQQAPRVDDPGPPTRLVKYTPGPAATSIRGWPQGLPCSL
jgi:hypothetical protein